MRIAIGKLMFSKPVERFFFCLIILFAGTVFVSVAMRDDLGDARIYMLSFELVLLAIFLMELFLKLVAVGWVRSTQVFLKSCWNIIDWVIVVLSISLTIVELIPEVQSIDYVQMSAILRLFRLVITFRKTNEFRRIHHKFRRVSTQDFTIEMASERALELLRSLLWEPWVQANQSLVNEIHWCIEVIATNKLYDTVLTIKKESEPEKDHDLVNLVRIFSANNVPGNSSIGSKRRSSSLIKDGNSLADMKYGLTDDVIQCLNMIDSNDFNVFSLKSLTQGKELVTLLHVLFARTDLCLTTNINPTQFATFIQAVQAAYRADNPYHNATHAADVLQSIHYFLGTCGVEAFLNTSALDIAGAYLAASVHDMDHPGVNNTYLVNSQAKLAFRYNDKAVLENHHIASAFALTMEEDKDLFSLLSGEDYKHVRELMIEMVLSTDIAQHFSLLTKFRTRFLDKEVGEVKAEDRVLGLSFLLHASDISNPSRPWEMCRKWTSLVMKEFWEQGDQERARHLEVTYLMDRYTVNIPKSQISFIDVIVSPVIFAFKEIRPKFEVSCQMLAANKEKWAEKVNDFVIGEDSPSNSEEPGT